MNYQSFVILCDNNSSLSRKNSTPYHLFPSKPSWHEVLENCTIIAAVTYQTDESMDSYILRLSVKPELPDEMWGVCMRDPSPSTLWPTNREPVQAQFLQAMKISRFVLLLLTSF